MHASLETESPAHILEFKYDIVHILKKGDAGDMCIQTPCAWLATYIASAHGPFWQFLKTHTLLVFVMCWQVSQFASYAGLVTLPWTTGPF